MGTRDVFLELLSPALVRARRERPARSVAPDSHVTSPCAEAPVQRALARPVLVRAAR